MARHRTRRPPRRGLLTPLRFFVVMVLVGASAGLAAAVVVFHLGVAPVLTASMEPTYGPGAVLLTERVPVSTLRPGEIVLFVPPGESVQYAHRITSVTGPADRPVITTKGDANPAPDPWHAQLTSAYVPRVIAQVPWVGRLMVGVQGPLQIVLVVGGALVAFIAGTRWLFSPRRGAHTRRSPHVVPNAQ